MSTYRERRLAKANRLRGWAEARESRDSSRTPAEQALDAIPFGQPILVGHHSERRHRNAVDKADNAMRRRMESLDKAEDMASRADNIEAAAERAIYSDDEDAVERLRERIAELEAQRTTIKAANAEYRKAHKDELKGLSAYQRDQALPYQGYVLTNLGGNINRNKKRLAQMEREKAQGPTARIMFARFDSDCSECGDAMHKGDQIAYTRATRSAVCMSCHA